MELVVRWQENGDRQAAHELVMSHLPLVSSVVRRHRGYGLPDDDLFQEGVIGLMQAVKRFAVGMGVRLSSYAVRWVTASVREFIFRNWRLVRLPSGSAMRSLFFSYRSAVEKVLSADPQTDRFSVAQTVADVCGTDLKSAQMAMDYFDGSAAEMAGSIPDVTMLGDPSQHMAIPVGSSEVASAIVGAVKALPPPRRGILLSRRPVRDLIVSLGGDTGSLEDRPLLPVPVLAQEFGIPEHRVYAEERLGMRAVVRAVRPFRGNIDPEILLLPPSVQV